MIYYNRSNIYIYIYIAVYWLVPHDFWYRGSLKDTVSRKRKGRKIRK